MYGLTCKHFLLPMGLTAPGIRTLMNFRRTPKLRESTDAPISDHSTVAVDGAMVLQPARVDVEEVDERLTQQIAYFHEWLDDPAVEERNVKLGLASPSRRAEKREQYCEILAEQEGKKVPLDSFKPFMPFGTVHTVPGSLKNPSHGCVRDWVLFKLFEDRFRVHPRDIVNNERPLSHHNDQLEAYYSYSSQIYQTNLGGADSSEARVGV